MKEGKVKRLLTEHADQARLSKQLATIQLDMDIALDIEGSRLGPHDDEAVREVFDRLEFRSLLGRIPTYGAPAWTAQAPAPAADGGGPGRARSSTPSRRPSTWWWWTAWRRPRRWPQRLRARGRHRGAHRGRRQRPARRRGRLSRWPRWTPRTLRTTSPSATRTATLRDGVLDVLARLLGDESMVKHGYDLKQELLAWTARGVDASRDRLRLHAGRLPLHHHAHARALADGARPTTSAGSPSSPRRCCSAAGGRAGARRRCRWRRRRSTTATWWRWSRRCARRSAPSSTRGRCNALFDDLEMPLVPILAAMERVGIRVDCDELAAAVGRAAAAHRRARGGRRRDGRVHVQPRLDAAAGDVPLRQPRPGRRPAHQDRAQHRRRQPRVAARRARRWSTSSSSGASSPS